MIWSQTTASSRTRPRLLTGYAVRAVKRAWRGGLSSRGNRALTFTPEAEEIHGDLAVAPWVLQWGAGEQDRVRGVNLIRIRDGRIVEARGYVKA